MKKLLMVLMGILFLVSCGNAGGVDIGLAMPTKSSERWIADGGNMKKEFENLGYKVDLQYAEDVVENQVAQIENMITKGVKIIIIAPIDGEAVTDVLEKANEQGIQVIAYDR